MSKKNSHQQLRFGALPIDYIAITLGIELKSGDVVMSANAQKHASRKHPNDFGACLPFVAQILANPLYMGDDEKNEGKIEIVGRPPRLGRALLIAVEISVDDGGFYNVVSFYPVSETKIQRRRDKGHLHVAKNKRGP